MKMTMEDGPLVEKGAQPRRSSPRGSRRRNGRRRAAVRNARPNEWVSVRTNKASGASRYPPVNPSCLI
jgi:hypothetical protein